MIFSLYTSCRQNELDYKKIIVRTNSNSGYKYIISNKNDVNDIMFQVKNAVNSEVIKMGINTRLEIFSKNDTMRIGVLNNNYKYNRKYYKCNLNLEKIINEILIQNKTIDSFKVDR